MTRATVKCFDGDGNPFEATIELPMSPRAERIIRRAMTPPAQLAAEAAEMTHAVQHNRRLRARDSRALADEKARAAFIDLPMLKRIGLDLGGLRERWIEKRQKEIAAEMGVDD